MYSQRYDKIYIGFTSDLIERFYSHNYLGSKGWTTSYRPWEVIYCEFFEDKKQAMEKEKILKGSSARRMIRRNIRSQYPGNGYISF